MHHLRIHALHYNTNCKECAHFSHTKLLLVKSRIFLHFGTARCWKLLEHVWRLGTFVHEEYLRYIICKCHCITVGCMNICVHLVTWLFLRSWAIVSDRMQVPVVMRLSEISKRIMGEILQRTIWYHALFFFWRGVYKYCCLVYGTVWCGDEVRSANCPRIMRLGYTKSGLSFLSLTCMCLKIVLYR